MLSSPRPAQPSGRLTWLGRSTLPAMVKRGWGSSTVLAFLAAAATAAAQMGLGYGLGIVVWVPDQPDAADAAWAAGLAWTVFVAAVAVVVGATVGDRSAGNVYSGGLARLSGRVTLVVSAALGGCVTIPLVAVPAHRVRIVDNFAPDLLAGTYAAAGVVLGLAVALFALASRAISSNVIATASFLWALALVAVSTAGDRIEVTHLGVWRFTEAGPIWRSFYVPGALVMLGGALLIGGLASFPAAGRGAGRLGVTISGAAGPAIVAVAYGLAAPRPGHATVEQLSALHTSPYMVLAGLVGSGLVAAAGSAPARRSRAGRPAAAPAPPVSTPSTNVPDGLTPSAGRRATTLPSASASAVSATARVPPASRAEPSDEWRRR